MQFGVENVVATLGTAMTAENMKRLTRLTDRVMFCFDGDRAGRAAAWRAMETALPFGGGTVELKFLLLPEKDDPDTFVRSHGADAFRALAEQAAPLPDFLVKELDARVDFANRGRPRTVRGDRQSRCCGGYPRAAIARRSWTCFAPRWAFPPDVFRPSHGGRARARRRATGATRAKRAA